MGHGKYIGRLGALAVALGVTAAVASPAHSHATPSDGATGGESSATTSDSSPAGGDSSSPGAQSDAVDGLATQDSSVSNDAVPDSAQSGDGRPTTVVSSSGGALTSRAADDGSRPDGDEDADAGQSSDLATMRAEDTASVEPEVSTSVKRSSRAKGPGVDAGTMATAAAAEDVTDPPAVVSVDAHTAAPPPSANGSLPRDPAPASPGLWALAAVSRREIGQVAEANQGSPSPARVAAAVVSEPIGNAVATAQADVFSELFASVQAIFDSVVLMVRRTFFNQAPTVNPVQITGHVEGPITGTIGAIDPEGDPIVYSVTGTPDFGSVVINPDGSYTYTPGSTFAGLDTFSVVAADTGLHINLFDLFRPAGTEALLEVTQGGPRVTFNFIYGAGSEFWSQEARGALRSAAMSLSSYFVVTSPVVLTYTVTGMNSPSLTLATAESELISGEPGFFSTVVQQKILSGIDANGAAPDGQITFNFARSWAYGDSVGNAYDFQSVAMHELVHTFGFLSEVDKAGSNTDRSWTLFDSFIVTSGDAKVIGPDFNWSGVYDTNLTGGNGGLYFGGPNAVAAYGGPVPLFTPNPWRAGSSVTHLNDSTFSGANRKLMNPFFAAGPGPRTLSAVELGILADLGYTLASPNQAFVVAFIAIAFVRRRGPSDRRLAGRTASRGTE